MDVKSFEGFCVVAENFHWDSSVILVLLYISRAARSSGHLHTHTHWQGDEVLIYCDWWIRGRQGGAVADKRLLLCKFYWTRKCTNL